MVLNIGQKYVKKNDFMYNLMICYVHLKVDFSPYFIVEHKQLQELSVKLLCEYIYSCSVYISISNFLFGTQMKID